MMKEIDIVHMIYENSMETAPVILQFGRVENNICKGGDVIIKKCPPAITRMLAEAGCWLDVTEDGVHVYKL